jgi:CBS domain-containing protein
MKAEDLMEAHPIVRLDAPMSDAARVLVDRNTRAILVVDDKGELRRVITDAMLLRFLLPPYVAEAESLAGVLQEQAADTAWKRLKGRTVAEAFPEDPGELPQVEADATLIQVASSMVATKSAVVAVRRGGRIVGAITLSILLDRLVRP